VLCVLVLCVAARLVEPDDYAYRASIVAITDGQNPDGRHPAA
jgi:hypothetical protein